MNLKTGWLVLSFTLIISIILMGTVFAQENELVDPEIPESWYEEMQTASEKGINEFNQSPMLDKRVEEGELPPVEERLPADPPVIEPYGEIGEYGGTASVWGTGLDYGGDVRYLEMTPTAGQPTPDGNKMVPYYVKGWDYSDDYKKLTIELREGVKYSDGTPLTADDVIYWWEYEANNIEFQPVPPEEWSNPYLEVTKDDKYTVTYEFGKPNPKEHEFNFQNNFVPGVWGELPPSNYMKDFHPEFVGEEKVVEMAEEVGLDRWDEYYGRIRDDSVVHPEYEYQRPTLRPYVAVERSETTLLLERNPYYPFVDTAGNQLPYIDKIRISLVNDEEMAATKAATGEATIGGRFTKTKDIPLYKRNEEEENYNTLIYYRAYGSEFALHFNLTEKDQDLREVFQNVDFRRAISLAIDRENINRKIYYGRANPMQATVPSVNEMFKEEYAEAYADYNPEKARQLFDEIGMKDNNGDGYREFPDGSKFNPTLLYCKIGPVEPTSLLELVRGNLEEVGINIDLKMVSRELKNQRGAANDFEISGWTVDGIAGYAYGHPQHMAKTFAPSSDGPPHSPWPAWSSWYATKGEEGMEPPPEIKELNEALNTLSYGTDEKAREDAGRKLLEAQAENLWVIGTVGLAPQPIIVKNKLKNVARKGVWDWNFRYMRPMFPVQFYLDE